MEFNINKENEEYDQMLVSQLWSSWKQQPNRYTDASGVSMRMSIETAFKKSGAKEPDGISKDEIKSFQEPMVDLEFFDSGYMAQRHRIRLDKMKAEKLKHVLEDFLNTL
jgi:hypothetical protein